MKEDLPALQHDIIHVFKTNSKKLTIHTNAHIDEGDKIHYGLFKLKISKVVKKENSTYYKNANFFELEYSRLN